MREKECINKVGTSKACRFSLMIHHLLLPIKGRLINQFLYCIGLPSSEVYFLN